MLIPNDRQVRIAVESVARESYGRLIAFLSARTRDVAAAEDALSDALVAALTTWLRDGIPDNPQAWLMTAARNRLADRARHAQVRSQSIPTLQLIAADTSDESESDFPDERLKLLFVCAHPAIDPDMHTPLMLQTVMGLDAAAIARAFLIAPQTMGQRLVRAKKKIRETGIAFAIPERDELAQRLDAVLNAIYAAYGSGWEDVAGVDPRARGLTEEAIWLARVLRKSMPEPEVRGLLSLMLHCEARRNARRVDGQFIPLNDQDTRLWNAALIDEAEQELLAAAQQSAPAKQWGRFQLEAAIQSVHAERIHRNKFHRIDWRAISLFYEQLAQLSPTLGARVAGAAAKAEMAGPDAGLALLDAIDPIAVVSYQPYWAVRAHLLKQLRQTDAAVRAFDLAIGLSTDEAVRQFLLMQREV